jgi:tetratricopeptide (TPR) repeat protein
MKSEIIEKVAHVTGGLPLAIQWVIGQYRLRQDLDSTLQAVRDKDSPILEFSFRNVWSSLSADAKAVLAVLSVFDSPPTIAQLTIATEYPRERIEDALRVLEEVTLVTRRLQDSDGHLLFVALPITLNFASNQLSTMGDFEARCRQRLQRFAEQMQLQESEARRFRGTFERYGVDTDNERRAAILCRRAESDLFAGNVDNAELLLRQALEMAPTSAYALTMSASFELARGSIGKALDYAEEGCARCTRKTGALCYTILARVKDAQHDKQGRVTALEKALEYEPEDNVIRHQFGVALSRSGKTEAAIQEFSRIIDSESTKAPPTPTLVMALTTRVINLRRLARTGEADADLQRAIELVREYPHLQHCAQKVVELED